MIIYLFLLFSFVFGSLCNESDDSVLGYFQRFNDVNILFSYSSDNEEEDEDDDDSKDNDNNSASFELSFKTQNTLPIYNDLTEQELQRYLRNVRHCLKRGYLTQPSPYSSYSYSDEE